MKRILSCLLIAVMVCTLFLSSVSYVDAAETSGKRLVKIVPTMSPTTEFVNNESGTCITEIMQTDPNFICYTSISYNASGKVSERLDEYYFLSSKSWLSHRKESYSYTKEGLIESIIISAYIEETGKWEVNDNNSSYYSYEFDAAGHKIKETIRTGSVTNVYSYQYSGNQLVCETHGTQRIRYEYASGSVSLFYEEDPESTGTWVPVSGTAKEVIETTGNVKTRTLYQYVSANWTPQSQHVDTYNGNGQLLSTVKSTYVSDQWKPSAKLENNYDSVGDLLSSVNYNYNEGNSSWEYNGDRTDYYYMDNLDILNGKNQTVFPDGSQTLTFRSEAPLSELNEVRVDGKPCSSANYDATSGSTIITLHADYLETLKPGRHVLSIVSDSGIATVDFNTSSAPLTGDTPDIFLWSLFLLSSLGAMVFLVRRQKI